MGGVCERILLRHACESQQAPNGPTSPSTLCVTPEQLRDIPVALALKCIHSFLRPFSGRTITAQTSHFWAFARATNPFSSSALQGGGHVYRGVTASQALILLPPASPHTDLVAYIYSRVQLPCPKSTNRGLQGACQPPRHLNQWELTWNMLHNWWHQRRCRHGQELVT